MTHATEPLAEQASARQKLLDAALRLFANRGFDGASTRDIAELAGVNVSSIRYYFGDKLGLYQAVYTEALALEKSPYAERELTRPPASLHDSLAQFFQDFLDPLKQGEALRLVMKIHFREMIEPSGTWQNVMHDSIRNECERLQGIILQALHANQADTEIKRMAFSLLGMAVHFYVAHDFASRFEPELVADATSIDALAQRLAAYAVAVIKSERRRRAASTERSDA